MILVINSGSSSLKFGLFTVAKAGQNLECLCRGNLSWISGRADFSITHHKPVIVEPSLIAAASGMNFNTVEEAYQCLCRWLHQFKEQPVIEKVCYRIVHGGHHYNAPVFIDESVMTKLEALVPLAPLHQPLALQGVRIFRVQYPQALHVACFDTAFHRSMPQVAQTFALPEDLRVQGVKRYGFHGLSYHYVVTRLRKLLSGEIPKRVIVAHLGSGASLCALNAGVSVATTMSFSPLDGLPMATRSGAIDAAAVLYLLKEMKFSLDEVSDILNTRSGLLGLSGVSGDVRELLQSDSEEARHALDFYVYRICQEIGGLMAILQGVDALVFTGGAGAHCEQLRKRICAQFEWLGVRLDGAANKNNELAISEEESTIALYCLQTDEEWMMAKLSADLSAANTRVES